MTDKLNNLVIAELPEVGGYYRAGDCGLWDEELTEGKLYLIVNTFDDGFGNGGGDENDALVISDEGNEWWVSCSGDNGGRGISVLGNNPGTFYKNPANV